MHTQSILKCIRTLSLNAKGCRDESAKNQRNKSMQYYVYVIPCYIQDSGSSAGPSCHPRMKALPTEMVRAFDCS